MKRCNVCLEEKPLSDFWSDSQKRDGRHPSCKVCGRAKRRVGAVSAETAERRRKAQRKWRTGHPELVQQHNRASYLSHKESRKRRAATYRDSHRDEIRDYFRQLAKKRPDRISKERRRAYSKAWREQNLEHARALERQRRQESPEATNARGRRYRERHAEAIVAKNQRRRALLAGCHATLTRQEWVARSEEFGWLCAYCLRPMDRVTLDHFRPIAKGGDHVLENTVPSCLSCNCSKGDGLIFDWLPRGVGQCPPPQSTSSSTAHNSARTKR